MTNIEKCEYLKDTIYQLYSKEGRSKVYISKLLKIDRKVLIYKIREWELPEPEPMKHIKPSTRKFINKNKDFIISKLNNDMHINDIAKELKCDRKMIMISAMHDEDIKDAYSDFHLRIHQRHQDVIHNHIVESLRNYITEDDYLPGEEWKPILGYEHYDVSNRGRIRAYSKTYDMHYLMHLQSNKNNGRLYVRLFDRKNKKNANLQVARLVGFTFLSDSYSNDKNTINHKDGDVSNNDVNNLEWVSQSENNLHSYKSLGRKHNKKNKSDFKKIIYKDNYEFKTLAAFARFIEKSETQTRRYLSEPNKHDIKIVK